MRTRIIAALIVVSTVCWSMAPAASSLTLRWPSPSTKSKSASAHQHDCCPQPRGSFVPVLLATVPPATMPCGNEHPCCMQQSPDRSPALPVGKTSSRPDPTSVSGVIAVQSFATSFVASNDVRPEAVSDSLLLRSTVLRI